MMRDMLSEHHRNLPKKVNSEIQKQITMIHSPQHTRLLTNSIEENKKQ